MNIKLVILVSLLVLNSSRFKGSQQEIKKISLKGSSSYDEICNQVHENQFQKIKSVVEIQDGANLKTVSLFGADSGGYKRYINKFHLTLDSIHAYDIGTLPRKKLKIALKEFYIKREGRGFVQISLVSTRTSKDLESLLLNLIQEFDKMNSETEQSYDLHCYLLCITPMKPTYRRQNN